MAIIYCTSIKTRVVKRLPESSWNAMLQDPSGWRLTPFEIIGIFSACEPMRFVRRARMIGSIPEERMITGTLFFNVQS